MVFYSYQPPANHHYRLLELSKKLVGVEEDTLVVFNLLAKKFEAHAQAVTTGLIVCGLHTIYGGNISLECNITSP